MNNAQSISSEPFYKKGRVGKHHIRTRSAIFWCILILYMAFVSQKASGQGVGISEISIVPESSSILELRSSLRGFLAPRMTTFERLAIATPAQGLLVYDTTTESFWYYNTGWKAIAAGALGASNQLLGMNLAGTANEYKTLNGTTNQVNVQFPVAGSIVLSTPQDIHTGASPTFSGLTVSGLTPNTGVYTNGTNGLTSSAPTSGTLGFWNRTGTILSPVTAGDAVTTTGNIYTTGTGAITSAGLLTGSAGASIAGGPINLNNNSGFVTNINIGSSAGNVSIGNSLNSVYLPKFTTPGLVHNDATGLLSTGLLLNGDITDGTIDLTTKVTNVLPIANGGTNSGTALINGRVMVSRAGQIVEAGAMNNGQLIVGSTGIEPQIVTMGGDISIDNIGTTTIGSERVINGMLGPDAVTSNKILDGTIDNADVNAAAAIDATKIAAGTVDNSEFESLNGVISPIQTQFSNLQGELDVTQTGAGLNATGTYTANGTANYISTATSLKNADDLLDTQVKLNADNIASGVTDLTALQTEVNAIETGSGLNADGTYTSNGTANYISTATSLKVADNQLDTQLKTTTDNLLAEVTRATAAESTLTTNLTAEVTRATAAESTLTANLAAEVTRATGVESTKANITGQAFSGVISATNLSGSNTGDQDLSGLMVKANNLSDLTNATTARTNLGLGTLATQNGTFSGTSSGINTGDQTSIVGITGTIAQFNTALTDADFATGGGTATGTNTGDNAINTLYSGLVTNATHTGDATGATALTVVGINGTLLSGLGTGILKNTTGTGVPSIAVAGTDYVEPNLTITGGTKTKITYDSKGLITAGSDATTADIAPSTDRNYVTDAQQIVLGNTSGTNTGDQTNITGNAGTATALATSRSIYGNSFNGTADLNQIIASTYGGTGNGFTKFIGPETSEKTFTLPNANATLARIDAAQTFSGSQTFSGLISGSLGLTVGGGSISLNNNAAANTTNIGTGTTTGAVTIGNANNTVAINGIIPGANPLVFDGASVNSNRTTFAIADPTESRTITFPNESGTVALVNAGANWLVGGNPGPGPLVLGSNDNSVVNIQSGSGTLNLGADAFAKTINIGNVTGATAVNMNTGTGNFTLNTNQLFINKTTGDIGMGTTSPLSPLHLVFNNATNQNVTMDAYSVGGNATLIGRKARGSVGSPSAVQLGDVMMTFGAGGYGATGWSGATRAAVKFYASENWSDAAQGTYLTFETTLSGTNTRLEKLRINDDGNVGIGQTNPTAALHLKAGTTNANTAPLKFTSGALLTTAEAGVIEFDGSAFYSSPVSSNRGVSPSIHFSVNSANVAMTNGTGVQSVLAPGQDEFTVAGSTTYEFEALFVITGMGATSRTIYSLFEGSSNVASILYSALVIVNDPNVDGATQRTTIVNQTSSTAITNSLVGASTSFILKGIIRINTGGTLIPRIQFSAAPGGTIIGARNSYFKLYPIGSNTVTNVGNWQ